MIINTNMESPRLNNMNIDQLRNYAAQCYINLPNGLRKDEIIGYIEGVKFERENKINKVSRRAVDLENVLPEYADLSPYRREDNWLAHLLDRGWTTVPVPNISGKDLERYKDGFYNWLENCSYSNSGELSRLHFSRNDRSTWTSMNIPPNQHGVFKNWLGHTSWQWEIREKCLPIFQRIWREEDLLCSFDGGCYLYPRSRDSEFSSVMHCDQGRFSYDFISIQGAFNMIDSEEDDGGLIVMNESHKIFQKYLDRHRSDGYAFYSIDMEDELVKDLQTVKVCAPAGHLLLWDARVFHCNIFPRDERERMVVYVSMMPRRGTDDKTIIRRIKAYEEGKMTNHWCYGPWLKILPKEPWNRDNGKYIRPNKVEIAQLNEVQMRMVGYSNNNYKL